MPLEIALLHGAQRRIEDHQVDVVPADQLTEVFEGTAAQQTAWPRAVDARDLGANDIEANCLGETDGFLEPGLY
jgi:hypothetical protein